MKEIPLTQEYVALVDDEDYERLMEFKWFAHLNRRRSRSAVYAKTNLACGPYKQRTMSMHQAVLGQSWVDHRNGNGLDNRRANLRPATNAQNCANATKRQGCVSPFKGVTWNNRVGMWCARIGKDYKRIHLGYFRDEFDAATAYNFAALEYFGDFARMNTPSMEPTS